MTNYGFVINNRTCIGCHACTVACKAEHDDPLGVNKTWVKYIEKGTFPHTSRKFSVTRCNHCDDSPCTEICPTNALWEREDGIVDIDPERCIGCKGCLQACPYDALYMDPERGAAGKCNYCSHRVDSGREPACVTVCPEDAIIAGDIEDPDSKISRLLSSEEIQVRKPEKGTDPKLFYIDGDEGNITPGSSTRSEHYMWSDAPSQTPTHALEQEEFDLARAAESLAASDVSLPEAEDTSIPNDPPLRDGEDENGRISQAYELLQQASRSVYDVEEDHTRSWGWKIVAYVMTKSIAAGAFLVPALYLLFGTLPNNTSIVLSSAIIGGVFLAATGLLLSLDLANPKRFLWVLLRPNWSSWIVKGAYIITGYGLFLGLVFAGAWFVPEVISSFYILIPGAVLAAAAAIYTAFLFGQSKGRDLWQSPLLPFHMLIQAVLAGGAVMGCSGLFSEEYLMPARLTLIVSLGIHALLVFSELFTTHPTEDSEEAARRIYEGEFQRTFWLHTVTMGMVLPVLILLLSSHPISIAAASIFALGGLTTYEYCYITAPQTLSLA